MVQNQNRDRSVIDSKVFHVVVHVGSYRSWPTLFTFFLISQNMLLKHSRTHKSYKFSLNIY